MRTYRLCQAIVLGLVFSVPLLAIDLPPLSGVLKATDLEPLIQKLISSLETDTADAATFNQAKTRVQHAGYTLALYAEAVAQVDGDVSWKANARAIRDLAAQLGSVTNHAKARQLLEQIKSGLTGASVGQNGAAKSWEEVAPLLHVMKEVNLVNRSLRRYVRRERYFKRYHDRLQNAAVAMTLLSYIAAHDSSPAKDAKNVANPVAKYEEYSVQFFQLARQALEAVRANDFKKASSSVKAMQKVCSQCHEDFRPDIEI